MPDAVGINGKMPVAESFPAPQTRPIFQVNVQEVSAPCRRVLGLLRHSQTLLCVDHTLEGALLASGTTEECHKAL